MNFVSDLLELQLEVIDRSFNFLSKPDFYQVLSKFPISTDLWDAIHSPILSNKTGNIQDIISFINKTCVISKENEIAHSFMLLKLIQFVKCELIITILEQVPKISAEETYWRERISSPYSTILYGMEVIPQKLYNLVSINGIRYLKSFDWKLLDPSYKKFSTAFVGLQLHIKTPFSIVSFARNTIRENINALESKNSLNSKLLGKLIHISPFTKYYSKSADLQSLFHSGHECKDLSASFIINTFGEVIQSLNDEIKLLEFIFESAINETDEGSKDENTYNLDELYQKLNNMLSGLVVNKRLNRTKLMMERYGKPNFVTRNWIPTSIMSISLLIFFKKYSFSDIFEQLRSISFNVWDTFHSFMMEWIKRPLDDMIATIRHKEAKLAVMGTQSLSSDLDSLERMVLNFSKG